VATPVQRGDVCLINLEPTRGLEIRDARPCVVVSPDEMNLLGRTFIIAPLTRGEHAYPFRVPCRFRGQDGHVIVDQVRSIDVSRIVKRLGTLSRPALQRTLTTLHELFAP